MSTLAVMEADATTLVLGEPFALKGRSGHVTVRDVASVAAIRPVLIALARHGGTTSYGGLKEAADVPQPAAGLGRLLDLVGTDCRRRGEPDLAALVVTTGTGEVGDKYGGDAAREREQVYRWWADRGVAPNGVASSGLRPPSVAPIEVELTYAAANDIRRTSVGSRDAGAGITAPPDAGLTYVGLDLAWSEKNESGIAVVSAEGRLLASGTVVADDAVATWLIPYRESIADVAIDAPLVVPNLTGARPVEREMTKVFGSAGAGAYPSNRSNPLFAPPRGAALARRLGWTISTRRPDPSASRPTCIEVYPHPAMVTLFGLERVIPYKPRPTRTVADRRIALGTVLDHLEAIPALGLASSDSGRRLRAALRSAARPVDLKRAEDEIDGIFCAHLAWLWGTGSPALRVWGDDVSGFIVAPNLQTTMRRPPRANEPHMPG